MHIRQNVIGQPRKPVSAEDISWLRPHGEQELRHDGQPGYPVQYYVPTNTFSANLYGRAIQVGEFGTANQLGPKFESWLAQKDQRLFDPAPLPAMYVCWRPSKPSEVGAGGALPVYPPGYQYIPEVVATSNIERLPDVHVMNRGGTLDMFYQGYTSCPLKAFAGLPSWNRNGAFRPRAEVPELRPKIDRTEEFLEWVEQCAAASHIVPPYLQGNFVAASVLPPAHVESSTSEAGPSSEMALDASEDLLDLAPLQPVSDHGPDEPDDECVDADPD